MKHYNSRSGFNTAELKIVVVLIFILAIIVVPIIHNALNEIAAHGKFQNSDGVLEALKEGALGETIAARAAKEGFELIRIPVENIPHAFYSMGDEAGTSSILIYEDALYIMCAGKAADMRLDEQEPKILHYTSGPENKPGVYTLGQKLELADPEAKSETKPEPKSEAAEKISPK